MWFVQFHASYGYEDFVFGYRPVEDGFAPHAGPFLEAVEAATGDPERRPHVLVIDELSRADVGRVFGEALTYVDRTKRGRQFLIASGDTIAVPTNLLILATMDPLDRGVDEVDAAFERRFAKIRMDPDVNALEEILADHGVDQALRRRIAGWFKHINGLARKNLNASVGHAYFNSVEDEQSLRGLWEYQLQFLVERAFRLDEPNRSAVEHLWSQMFASDSSPSPAGADDATAATPEGPET